MSSCVVKAASCLEPRLVEQRGFEAQVVSTDLKHFSIILDWLEAENSHTEENSTTITTRNNNKNNKDKNNDKAPLSPSSINTSHSFQEYLTVCFLIRSMFTPLFKRSSSMLSAMSLELHVIPPPLTSISSMVVEPSSKASQRNGRLVYRSIAIRCLSFYFHADRSDGTTKEEEDEHVVEEDGEVEADEEAVEGGGNEEESDETDW
ncbi:hypothetical protein PVL29_008487 [Vitis rotundifolia]|uniref:FAF domain-containing protein n=1 Tax=Vitis rotundifolia TaxID=103349 RepID=A0AA38ZVX9_VITRO|nr:hypothetical protein PVL29_008487 [Vitis rotundifolia]